MSDDHHPRKAGIACLILPLYVPTLCIMLGHGMTVPVLPLFARFLGAGLAVSGVVVSMRAVGALLFDLPAGTIVTRIRRLPTLLLAAGAAAVIAALTGLVYTLASLSLLTVAMGAAQTLWFISIQTHIRQNFPFHQVGRAMALVGGTLRIGGTLGPILGGFIANTYGLQAVYFAQALLSSAAMISVIVGSSHYRHPTQQHKDSSLPGPGLPFLRTVHGRWRPLVLIGLVVIILEMLRIGRQTLLPLWGEHIHLDVAEVGLILGLSQAVELLLFYPAGILMDSLGRKWASVPCLCLLSVGLALVPFTQSFSGLLLVTLIAGIGNGLGSGIVMALGSDLSPAFLTGEFLAVWHLLGDFGALCGPLLIGMVSEGISFLAATLLIAGFGLLGAWIMVFRVAETLVRKQQDR